ncbi:hypothetical protein QR685DRAFT_572404 [Neurospora intermedia]|uniref:Uncharacterized protein n=1 Tax=Neurospora intermedia TaxID=5142 RepID=A0ABR3D9P1_NEUIN
MIVSSSLCSRCPEPRSASSIRCSSQLIAMTKRGIVELCHCEPQRTGVLLASGYPTSSLLAAVLKTLLGHLCFGIEIGSERGGATS